MYTYMYTYVYVYSCIYIYLLIIFLWVFAMTPCNAPLLLLCIMGMPSKMPWCWKVGLLSHKRGWSSGPMVNTRGSDTNCKLQGIPHGGAMTIHARYHVLIMAQMFRVFVFSSCGLPCILLCNIYQHPKDDFLLPRYILATTTEDSDRISARQR